MANNTLTRLDVDATPLITKLRDIENAFVRIDQKSKDSADKMTQNFNQSTESLNKRNVAWTEQIGLIKRAEQEIKKYTDLQRKATNPKDLARYNQELLKAKTNLTNLRTVGTEGLKAVNRAAVTAAGGVQALTRRASIGTQVFNRLRTTLLTTFGVFGVIRAVRNTTNIVKDFEAGMANVRAITGAVGDDFERLSNLAKNIGGIFSPTEITELEVKLAKLGFTINEIVNMTEGIVNLSIATGEDLNAAAELTASTIRGLGLASSDTMMVVDQLGKSFVSSGLDISKYRESIKFISPIAKDMGVELSAIVGILGKLADRQIFGSLAGTAFRRILIRMADSSSNLSKKLGFTVRSSEDLVRAFTQLKEEGTSFAEILTLVDVRSLTAMSALIDNADVLKDYIEEIKNANGVIEEMAEIQLETLKGQLGILNQSWQSLITTMQDSGGTFRDVAGGFALMLQDMRNALMEESAKLDEELNKFIADAQQRMEARASSGQVGNIFSRDIDEATANLERLKELRARTQAELDSGEITDVLLIDLGEKRLEEYGLAIDFETNKISKLRDIINDFRQKDIISGLIGDFESEFERLKASGVGAETALTSALDNTTKLIKANKDAAKENPLTDPDAQARFINNLKAQLDALSTHFNKQILILKDDQAKQDVLNADADKKAKALIRKQFELAKLRASLEEDEFDKKKKILQATADFNVAMAGFEEDNAEKIRLIKANLVQDLEDLEVKRSASEQKELDKRLKEALKGIDEAEKAARAQFEVERQLMIANGRTTEQIKKAEIELEIILLKARIANIQALTGETDALALLRKELEALQVESGNIATGFEETEDKITSLTKKEKEFIRAFRNLSREAGRIATSIADAHVRATTRIVDSLNIRVAETQRALQAEISLSEQGLASNIALRQKELANVKSAREQALRDQEAALERQQAIESAIQAVNLMTTVSNIFKSTITTPFGLFAAIAATGLIFAAFEALKGDAVAATKFEKGGWEQLGGQRHSQGGVSLGVMGEGEKGEIASIFSRKAVRKHKNLITGMTDMINNDNVNFAIDHKLTDRIGENLVVVNSNVNLDESTQLKEMNALMKKTLNNVQVTQFGDRRVEKVGNRTRIIRNG